MSSSSSDPKLIEQYFAAVREGKVDEIKTYDRTILTALTLPDPQYPKNKSGLTALMVAAMYDQEGVVDFLLETKAINVLYKDPTFKGTAIDDAAVGDEVYGSNAGKKPNPKIAFKLILAAHQQAVDQKKPENRKAALAYFEKYRTIFRGYTDYFNHAVQVVKLFTQAAYDGIELDRTDVIDPKLKDTVVSAIPYYYAPLNVAFRWLETIRWGYGSRPEYDSLVWELMPMYYMACNDSKNVAQFRDYVFKPDHYMKSLQTSHNAITALYLMAARYGELEDLKIFLNYSRNNVNALVDKDYKHGQYFDQVISTRTGMSALSLATRYGHEDVVDYLLTFPDIDVLHREESYGATAIDEAAARGSYGYDKERTPRSSIAFALIGKLHRQDVESKDPGHVKIKKALAYYLKYQKVFNNWMYMYPVICCFIKASVENIHVTKEDLVDPNLPETKTLEAKSSGVVALEFIEQWQAFGLIGDRIFELLISMYHYAIQTQNDVLKNIALDRFLRCGDQFGLDVSRALQLTEMLAKEVLTGTINSQKFVKPALAWLEQLQWSQGQNEQYDRLARILVPTAYHETKDLEPLRRYAHYFQQPRCRNAIISMCLLAVFFNDFNALDQLLHFYLKNDVNAVIDVKEEKDILHFQTYQNGRTMLMGAARYGRWDIADRLLTQFPAVIDVLRHDEEKMTPIDYAAADPKHALVDKSTKPNPDIALKLIRTAHAQALKAKNEAQQRAALAYCVKYADIFISQQAILEIVGFFYQAAQMQLNLEQKDIVDKNLRGSESFPVLPSILVAFIWWKKLTPDVQSHHEKLGMDLKEQEAKCYELGVGYQKDLLKAFNLYCEIYNYRTPKDLTHLNRVAAAIADEKDERVTNSVYDILASIQSNPAGIFACVDRMTGNCKLAWQMAAEAEETFLQDDKVGFVLKMQEYARRESEYYYVSVHGEVLPKAMTTFDYYRKEIEKTPSSTINQWRLLDEKKPFPNSYWEDYWNERQIVRSYSFTKNESLEKSHEFLRGLHAMFITGGTILLARLEAIEYLVRVSNDYAYIRTLCDQLHAAADKSTDGDKIYIQGQIHSILDSHSARAKQAVDAKQETPLLDVPAMIQDLDQKIDTVIHHARLSSADKMRGLTQHCMELAKYEIIFPAHFRAAKQSIDKAQEFLKRLEYDQSADAKEIERLIPLVIQGEAKAQAQLAPLYQKRGDTLKSIARYSQQNRQDAFSAYVCAHRLGEEAAAASMQADIFQNGEEKFSDRVKTELANKAYPELFQVMHKLYDIIHAADARVQLEKIVMDYLRYGATELLDDTWSLDKYQEFLVVRATEALRSIYECADNGLLSKERNWYENWLTVGSVKKAEIKSNQQLCEFLKRTITDPFVKTCLERGNPLDFLRVTRQPVAEAKRDASVSVAVSPFTQFGSASAASGAVAAAAAALTPEKPAASLAPSPKK